MATHISLTTAKPTRGTPDSSPEVSIVIPCLNEVKTIGAVVRKAHDAFSASAMTFEIIVADNGSTDGSQFLARSMGAAVIQVEQRGYGAALQGGFAAARAPIILFGDADGTYDFGQGPALVDRLRESKAAMTMGSRMKGDIERGAMPLLHRYLGTPVLTSLINVLFRATITDCNSGFRAFWNDRYQHWGASSAGMEFASEMIVSCLKSGDQISELPIPLLKDRRDRTPHLSTWRDGMRHLLLILSHAPHGFTYSGVALLALSLMTAVPCMILGQVRVGPFAIFDFHSLILSILVGFFGAQAIVYGLLLDSKSRHPLPINHWFLNLREVTLLKLMVGLVLLILSFAFFIIWTWVHHGFNNINYLRPSLSLLYVTVVAGSLALGLFITQIHKRS